MEAVDMIEDLIESGFKESDIARLIDVTQTGIHKIRTRKTKNPLYKTVKKIECLCKATKILKKRGVSKWTKNKKYSFF